MIQRMLVYGACVGLLVTGCGRILRPQSSSNPINTKTNNITLKLFGAKFCEVCKSKIPKIHDLMQSLPATTRKAIDVQVYVTAGDPPSEHPNQDMAEEYRDEHFPGAKAFVDPWFWKNFRKYIPGKPDVPAAAVFDAQGNLLKTYIAGDTTFVPAEIVGYVNAAATGN